MNILNVVLNCYHANQCDRKKCTALRLSHLKLLNVYTELNKISRSTIILDPFAEKIISKQDQNLVKTNGLTVIDCSWEKAELVFQIKFKNGRKLPLLLAANSVNYGKWNKLSSVEALAAALILVGFDEQAKKILEVFPWGMEFIKINHENFKKYID